MSATNLWGGRFRRPLDSLMRSFSSSLPVDQRLARQDLDVSMVHARGLLDAGILNSQQHDTLQQALALVAAEVGAGTFPNMSDPDHLPEDIHSAVEERLVELCGEIGQRLHAGRSRNDQVVTDTLLWLREASHRLTDALNELRQALVEQAELHIDTVTCACTHMQRGQPVLLAHHLLAHVEALDRDQQRLEEARRRADRCPLGAGAGVGSTLPLNRQDSARRLGFAAPVANSLDAVADRDWAVDHVSACAMVMNHLSRLATELVLGSTAEFGTVILPEEWCTGSSMMPQKRNPDAAELVRARSARVFGHLQTLLALTAGLPLAYNRDLQEDKEALFDAHDTTLAALQVMTRLVAGARFQPPAALAPDFSCATDLAEELVRRGVPFREAHRRLGALVAACEEAGCGLDGASAEQLAEAGLADLDRALLSPAGSIAAKKTMGSTAPQEVARGLARAQAKMPADASLRDSPPPADLR